MSNFRQNLFDPRYKSSFYRVGFGVRIYILSLLITAITLLATPAFNSSVKFRHLTIEDGLSQGAVFAILQDHKGFMWFGTKDGLNRYDGYSFTVFEYDPFDSTSISDNFITALFEDYRGNLWIGTLNGGLNKFDRSSETFRRYLPAASQPGALSAANVTAISGDEAGNLWVGTLGGGVNLLPAGESRFRVFRHDPANRQSLADDHVYAVYSDSAGNLWAGSGQGLSKFSPADTIIQNFTFPADFPESPPVDFARRISAIYPGEANTLWLGTAFGVARFSRSKGTVNTFRNRYETGPQVVGKSGWGMVQDIARDSSGALWLATSAELMRFDPSTGRYQYFPPNQANPHSPGYSDIKCLFREDNGRLWIGTNGYGVDILDAQLNRFQAIDAHQLADATSSGFSVRAIFEAADGQMWIGADRLYSWNRDQNALQEFGEVVRHPGAQRLQNVGAWDIIRDRRGVYWFATFIGLFRYDPRAGVIHYFAPDRDNPEALQESTVYGVFEDRDGQIWLVTERHLSRVVDEQRGKFRHYLYNPAAVTDQSMSPSLSQDEAGKLWFGSNSGLLCFDPVTEKFTHFRNDPADPASLSSNQVRCLLPDPKQPERFFWIGTAGGGINLLERSSGRFTHFTNKDGLVNNVVYGILDDEPGNLWISTNKGLSRLQVRYPQNGLPEMAGITNFDVSDGLQSNEFNTAAFFKSHTGELFFGGINGINYFRPEAISQNRHTPPVYFTDLKIFNRSVTPANSSGVLSRVISETEEITLPHGANVFSLEFVALDYTNPGKNRYAYLMEGLTERWIALGTRREVTFTNLDPGEYVLHVKGANSDGVWNETPARLRIVITPPWWRTGWAYLGYFLLAVALLYALRRYELNRQRLRHRLELEQVQSEKLQELDRLKSRFFANISHEFRTPLTLIIGPLQKLLEKSRDKGLNRQYRLMLQHSQRLLRLISQILDLTKMEAGKLTLHAVPGDIVSFVRGITFSFASMAEQKGVDLHFDCREASLEVYFDREKLEQVMVNLLSNALKFTEPGGRVMVKISREATGEKGVAALSVSDTGPGIPPDQLPHIFDRFYQVESIQANQQQGTGIGLALTRELVKLHRGKISIESEPGKGSTFTVHLPVGKEHLLAEEIVAISTPSDSPLIRGRVDAVQDGESFKIEAGSPPSVRGELEGGAKTEIVLIVEDNPDMRGYIREHLSGNYLIHEAPDGVQGFREALKHNPDLIISDVMMPGMDGFTLCEKLKTDPRTSHIPVILLTARASADSKISGLETGADDYLTKPFDARELRIRIKNLIDQRRRLRERFTREVSVRPADITVTSLDEQFLQKAMTCVEAHLADADFGVEVFASELAVSRMQLHRKLKALTGQSATQFIRTMRLKRAAQLLQQQSSTVTEIAYDVGFNNLSYFIRSFKKLFGIPPAQYATRRDRHS